MLKAELLQADLQQNKMFKKHFLCLEIKKIT